MSEHPIHWETSGTSRIPFAVYTQEDIHAKELERFFYKAHWNYVGLEAEIPNVSDFKRTSIGERSVIMNPVCAWQTKTTGTPIILNFYFSSLCIGLENG